ncbi:MAG: succinate dehydrogenase assembly factor 2 [Gammaproteobacteria bacterium]|nr:succinate dehydrogenase assembly factor 2 [Gammaproteobacteria bacterium]
MTDDADLRRLRWRCRRGMRELDALLMRFVDEDYARLTPGERAAFENLLGLPDPEILALLTGQGRSDDPVMDAIVSRILARTAG